MREGEGKGEINRRRREGEMDEWEKRSMGRWAKVN